MKKTKKLYLLLAAIVSVFLLTGIVNASISYGKYKAVADGLTEKIRDDLSEENLKVVITRASDLEISDAKQSLFGDGYYIIDRTRTPIFFEVIFNSLNNKVASVDYTFVENNSEVSDIFLQKLIIKKLGKDFKTQEIMISTDNIENLNQTGNIKKYRGTGEVKIGSLVMNTIKFEITLDGSAEKVLYKLDEM